MANIIVNNAAFVCQDPVFTGVTYTGTHYIFDLNWTSLGNYYMTFDPTTVITLHLEMNRPNVSTPYFSGFVTPPIPFDGVNFMVNLLDYTNLYTPKDNLVFTLTITNTGCDNSAVYIIPPDTIPN